MNLFNVSLGQTPKFTSASVATAEPETIGVSEYQFSSKYQQAIDEKQLSLKGGKQSLLSVDNDSRLSDSNILETDISAVDSETTDSHTEISANDQLITVNETDEPIISTDSITIVDDATELMAVGNVFLQQLTRSNQQLTSTLNPDVNTLNTSGNSLPPFVVPMTETVLIDGYGQKSDVNSDASVNNLPLSVTMTAPITPTSEMLLNMPSLDSGHLLTDSVNDSRLHQSMGVNANSDASLAQQLTGLTAVSSTTNTAKSEQAVVINNAQSPLLLTREKAGEHVHERINMMMAKNLKYVDIRLDPPELGKIQIKLNITQDQASVQFTVNNPQTRDIVEQAMPRLREMLQQQGLQLTQSSVQQESSQQFTGHQNNSPAHSQSGSQSSIGTTATEEQLTTDSDVGDVPVSVVVTGNKDQVDYYA